MKIERVCFLSLVVAAIIGCGISGESPNEMILENASTRLALRDGCIVSLLDRVRSVEHVSPQADSTVGLFRLQLVRGIQPAMDIDATQMECRVISKSEETFELEFTHNKATVRARITLAQTAGEIECSIAVTPSDENLAVGSVAYPVFETPIAVHGAVKHCLLANAEGKLRPLNRQAKISASYPARMFAQMIACLGVQEGFLLWTDDSAAHVKVFECDTRTETAVLAVRHLMPYVPGQAWESAYNTRLSFCGGKWQDAADIYRNWASGQYWCATKFKDRMDVPSFLHHPSLSVSVQLNTTKNLATLPDRLSDMSKRVDAPIVVRGTKWEKRGGWVGPDYFPPKIGEQRFRSFADKLKERDIAFMCEISGYTWVIGPNTFVLDYINKMTQEQKDDLVRFFNENQGPNVCEQQRDGTLNPQTKICRGSSLGKTFLQDMAVHMFDLGVTAFSDDSDMGPYPDGIGACFNPDHGHPVPCGPWSTEITRNAFRAIRAEAARRGVSDFLLTKEYCSETLNMDVHAYLARMSWTYTQPYIIPLCQYLYHEYLPVVLYLVQDAELADCIIFGQVPGTGVREGDIPDLLKDYYRSMQVYAKDYLLYGRMCRPLIPDIPASMKTVSSRNGETAEIAVPLIRQSAWDDGSGNIGVFAVNTQQQEMTVAVPAPDSGQWTATLYLGAEQQETKSVTAGQQVPWALPPGRLCAIIFHRQ